MYHIATTMEISKAMEISMGLNFGYRMEFSMGHGNFHGPWKFPGPGNFHGPWKFPWGMQVSRSWKFPGPGNFQGHNNLVALMYSQCLNGVKTFTFNRKVNS